MASHSSRPSNARPAETSHWIAPTSDSSAITRPSAPGSFGGMNRVNSADSLARQGLDSTGSFTNSVECRFSRHDRSNLSVSDLSSSSFVMREEEFPNLGATNTSSSTPRTSQRKNTAIQIVQTEDMPGSSLSRAPLNPSTRSSINAGRSPNQPIGDEDSLSQPRRRFSKGSNYNQSNKGYQQGLRDTSKFEDGRKFSDRRQAGGQDRIYYLGRLMTSILRHRAVELNLSMRDDGYVDVQHLLKLGIKTQAGLPLSVYTVDDVRKAVEQDNKQRFGLLTENGILLIRANQGHSIKVVESEKLLKSIVSADEVPVCVHGTFMKNIDSILKSGLSKMGRNHVHFASGLPSDDGIISGMRAHCEVLIYLDVEKALKDGMKLYISENGVILTDGFNGVVPRKYFAQVAKWTRGKITPMVVDAQS